MAFRVCVCSTKCDQIQNRSSSLLFSFHSFWNQPNWWYLQITHYSIGITVFIQAAHNVCFFLSMYMMYMWVCIFVFLYSHSYNLQCSIQHFQKYCVLSQTFFFLPLFSSFVKYIFFYVTYTKQKRNIRHCSASASNTVLFVWKICFAFTANAATTYFFTFNKLKRMFETFDK